MADGYVLYNPKAGGGNAEEDALCLQVFLHGELEYIDMTQINDYGELLTHMEKNSYIVIVGGDGTLNRFVNDTEGMDIPQDILYYPSGTGNDLAKDMGKIPAGQPFSVKEVLKDLPRVTVGGRTCRFLNAVGYGLDGYCCEVGDKLRETPGKKVNYSAIAIKGILGSYAPTKATVTVDGVVHTYDKVWIAPTMKGRFYGGGMMAAPGQDRLAPDRHLSVVVLHSAPRLKILSIMPGIFKGTHVTHRDCVDVFEGRNITVEFDTPRPLQIDGETISDVLAYTASVCAK